MWVSFTNQSAKIKSYPQALIVQNVQSTDTSLLFRLTLSCGKTKKAPPPADFKHTAKNFGFTAQSGAPSQEFSETLILS